MARHPALAVFVAALLVRLAYYADATAQPWFGALVLDSRYIASQARHLWETHAFAPGAFFRPPMYTAFLAVVHGLSGGSVAAVAPLLQHLLGAGFCVAVWAAARRAWNPAAGLWAGLAAALCAPVVFYEGELLGDGPALFLNALFLASWLAARGRGCARGAAAAGLWAGLSVITRPTVLPVAVLFAVVGFVLDVRAARRWRCVRGGWSGAIGRAAAFVAPVALIVGCVAARNAAQGDRVAVCSQGGINFFIGNNAAANGVNVIVPRVVEQTGEYRDWVEEYAILGWLQAASGPEAGLARYLAGDRAGARPSVVSGFWYSGALRFLAANPGAAARLYARKTVALFNDFEVRNNREFAFVAREMSGVLGWIPLTFGHVFALALVGGAAVLARRRAGLGGWVVLYTAATAATVVAFFVAGRLRLPLYGGLLVLAGIGAERVVAALRARRWNMAARRLALAAAGSAVAFWHWPVMDFRYDMAQPPGGGIRATSFEPGEWGMMASACLDAGKPAEAVHLAARAAAAKPGWAFPLLVAGNAHMAAGETTGAIRAYARAWALEPSDARAANNLGAALEQTGHAQEAAEAYEQALALGRGTTKAAANLNDLAGATSGTAAALRLGAPRPMEQIVAFADALTTGAEAAAPR